MILGALVPKVALKDIFYMLNAHEWLNENTRKAAKCKIGLYQKHHCSSINRNKIGKYIRIKCKNYENLRAKLKPHGACKIWPESHLLYFLKFFAIEFFETNLNVTPAVYCHHFTHFAEKCRYKWNKFGTVGLFIIEDFLFSNG